jgi:hypothetical protein
MADEQGEGAVSITFKPHPCCDLPHEENTIACSRCARLRNEVWPPRPKGPPVWLVLAVLAAQTVALVLNLAGAY